MRTKEPLNQDIFLRNEKIFLSKYCNFVYHFIMSLFDNRSRRKQ